MTSLLFSELRLQGRHYSYIAALFLSFAFGCFLLNRQTPDTDIDIGGVYFLIKTFAIQLLMLPALVAVFVARASVRDFEHNMSSLVYAASANPKSFVSIRLIALVLLCCCLFFSFGLGMLAGLAGSGQGVTMQAAASIAWSLVVLVVPNLVLVASLLYVVALCSKQAIYAYLAAIALFVGYQFFLMLSGSPLMATRIAPDPAMLIWYSAMDPFGLSAFFHQVASWSPVEKNQQLPTVMPELLANRVAVCTLGIVIAYLAIWRHANHFQLNSGRQSTGASWLRMQKARLSRLLRPFGFKVPLLVPQSPAWVVAAMAIRLTFKTKFFLALSGFLVFVTASEIYFGYLYLENLGTSAIPSTMVTINRYIADVLPTFGALFLLLLAAEICWRDRQCQFDPLVDSSPITNRQQYLGRLLAVLLLPLFFISLAILVSVLLQSLFGGQIELIPYLWLYIYVGLPMMCLGAVCVALHSLLPNKYLALVVTAAFFVATGSRWFLSLGLEHPLWTLGRIPVLSYSEIIGYAGELEAFWGTFLLRSSVALLLVVYCLAHLRRGEEACAPTLGFARAHWRHKLAVAGSIAGIALASVNIAWQSHYAGDYQASSERLQWRADYERQYSYLKQDANLKPDQVKLEVELFPKQRRLSIKAEIQLINRSQQAVSRLVFSTPEPFHFENIKLENGELVTFDPRFQVHSYQFDRPIQPGAGTTLTYHVQYQQNSYLGIASDKMITGQYAYVRMLRYLPWFGYQKNYELKGDNLRERFGLPAKSSSTLEQDIARYQGDMSVHYDWATWDTTIVTQPGHTAFAPGKLVAQWDDAGRPAFRYQTQGAIRNLGHIISTDLPYLEEQIEGVTAQVFYPKGKQDYAQLHMQAIRDAIGYGNKHFGLINSQNLRLVPVTKVFPSTGYALPQTIFIGEDVGFHVDLSNDQGFDHLYRRTVHEVAHQWWGHGLNGAATEGEGVLVETLAKYTETVLLAQKYGNDYVHRLIAYEQQRYFSGRGRAANEEVPLYRADDSYLVYSKGAAAMHSLAQQLGVSHINRALAKLVVNHAYPAPPATTLDLIRYLNQGANDQQQQLIDRWFKQIQVHDIGFGPVQVSQQGQYYKTKVCLRDHKGKPNQVELAALAADGIVIETKLLHFSSETGSVCLDWQLVQKPFAIEADPRLLLLDSDRTNNIVQLTD